MRVRVSRWGLLYWQGPHLVWDDYLAQRRLPLAKHTERLLRLFGEWQELVAVDALTDDPEERGRWQRVAAQLLALDVLVAEGSPRHTREQRLDAGWGHWPPVTRGYHFASRLTGSAPVPSQEEQDAAFDARLAAEPPPPAYKQVPDAPRVSLPKAALPTVDFATVLHGRRSHRSFGTDPLPLAGVATLLRAAAGPSPGYHTDLLDRHQTTFKTSASAGGRHPTELYPVVRNVSGIDAGVYHYDASTHTLELLGGPVDPTTAVELCTGQQWVAGAAVLLFYTSVFARQRVKYASSGTYRTLYLDVGHLNQTVYLLTTALGMRMTFTAILREDRVEALLGLDLAEEFVAGCAVIGAAV